MRVRSALFAAVATLLTAASVSAQSLPAPTLVTPGEMMIGDRYTFSWTRVPGATHYQLWITMNWGHVRTEWLTAAQAGCGDAQSLCAVMRERFIPTGRNYWWVRAWAPPDSYGAWSAARQITIAGRVSEELKSNTVLGKWAAHLAMEDDTNPDSELVAIGNQALYTFDSNAALAVNTDNTALGGYALRELSPVAGPAARNTGLGYFALNALVNGDDNTGIGWRAGANLTGGNNNIYLGSASAGSESNTLRLGSTQSRAFLSGVSGATSAGGIAVFVDGTGQLGTVTSSRLHKQNIRPIGSASSRLFQLRPVAFEYRADRDPAGVAQFGLIAEDVETIFPELVVKNADGRPETVRYHLLVPLLLNELQKQQEVNEEHARQLKALSERVEQLLRQR
jgi:hypothetical protein